jgi:hypothetical protein
VWRPIEKYDKNRDLEQIAAHEYDFKFDRTQVDRGLFEEFQNNGEKLYTFFSAKQCAADEAFWKTEE